MKKLTTAQAPRAPATRPMRIPTTYGTGPPIVRPVGSDGADSIPSPRGRRPQIGGAAPKPLGKTAAQAAAGVLPSSSVSALSRSLSVLVVRSRFLEVRLRSKDMSRDPILLLPARRPQRGLDRVFGVALAMERPSKLLRIGRSLGQLSARAASASMPSSAESTSASAMPRRRRSTRIARSPCSLAASTRARSSAARSSD